MILFDLLFWDAFSSGWYWCLLILQWIAHYLWVLGIPINMLRGGQSDYLGSVVDLHCRRVSSYSDTVGVVLVGIVSAFVSAGLILGFFYGSELFKALSFILVPEVGIIYISVNCVKRVKPDASLNAKIEALKKLHLKIQVFGGICIFCAGIIGFSHLLNKTL
jgi:hypothetical protein